MSACTNSYGRSATRTHTHSYITNTHIEIIVKTATLVGYHLSCHPPHDTCTQAHAAEVCLVSRKAGTLLQHRLDEVHRYYIYMYHTVQRGHTLCRVWNRHHTTHRYSPLTYKTLYNSTQHPPVGPLRGAARGGWPVHPQDGRHAQQPRYGIYM